MDSNTNMNGESSTGPVIATVIILAIILLGGLYFWGQRSTPSTDLYGNSVGTTPADSSTAAIDTQGTSDDPNSIQADLDNTDTNTVDSQLNGS